MTFPILVTHANGTLTASTFGTPSVSAAGATKEAALAAVAAQPKWCSWTWTRRSRSRLLCADIYRERAAQKAAEFPE